MLLSHCFLLALQGPVAAAAKRPSAPVARNASVSIPKRQRRPSLAPPSTPAAPAAAAPAATPSGASAPVQAPAAAELPLLAPLRRAAALAAAAAIAADAADAEQNGSRKGRRPAADRPVSVGWAATGACLVLALRVWGKCGILKLCLHGAHAQHAALAVLAHACWVDVSCAPTAVPLAWSYPSFGRACAGGGQACQGAQAPPRHGPPATTQEGLHGAPEAPGESFEQNWGRGCCSAGLGRRLH